MRKSMLWSVKDGAQVEIRLIQPGDEEKMIKFHKGLSERSVYMRYFESLSLSFRTAHPRLARICFADPEHQIVLVALSAGTQCNDKKIVAVGRLSKSPEPNRADVALLVVDEFQRRGLGSELLRHLVQMARDHRITRIEAEMLRDNTAIQRVLRKSGFRLRLIDPRSVRAVLTL
jgi:acetyltransferase